MTAGLLLSLKWDECALLFALGRREPGAGDALGSRVSEPLRDDGAVGNGDGKIARCVGIRRGVPGGRRRDEVLAFKCKCTIGPEPSWYGVHGDGGRLSIVGANCGVPGAV